MLDTNERMAVVIEDDPDIRGLLVEVLEQAGFETHTAGNGLDGVEQVRRYRPVLTTLDVSMPGIDGFEAAKRIRAFSGTYLIMLTARGDEIDTLMGLESGADDYMVKPFRPRELRARVDAMRRRRERDRLAAAGRAGAPAGAAAAAPIHPGVPSAAGTTPPAHEAVTASTHAAPHHGAAPHGATPHGAAPHGAAATPADPAVTPLAPAAPASGAPAAPGTAAPSGTAAAEESADQIATDPTTDGDDGWLEHRGLRLHPEMHLVSLDGTELDLTRTEFELLNLLMTTRRRVRSKADLALALRGESYVTSYYVSEADKRAVEVHLANLRRKLGESASHPHWIETVRGVGYRLTADE